MIRKYHLYDKFFVEYHTKADQHVLLNYSVNGGEYHKEEIPEVYDGIYVKAFVLLFGESVSFREASWGVESGGKPADFKPEYVWG